MALVYAPFVSAHAAALSVNATTIIHLSVKPAADADGPSARIESFYGALNFFWLCCCSAIEEILEYDGPIHAGPMSF